MSSTDEKNRPSILIVEDELALTTLLTYNLDKEGFDARSVSDGKEAVAAAMQSPPSLIVLDWMLPTLSGLDVCRQLRADPRTESVPIIMLTARGEESDKIQGLDSGADDYVVKPFSPSELIARIRAILRRAHSIAQADRPAPRELRFADVHLDLVAHRAYRGGVALRLGPTEFRMLRYFMENPRQVFSREHLLETIWGKGIHVEIRTVDVHIRRLRRTLNMDHKSDLIRTVRSAGYSLDDRME